MEVSDLRFFFLWYLLVNSVEVIASVSCCKSMELFGGMSHFATLQVFYSVELLIYCNITKEL